MKRIATLMLVLAVCVMIGCEQAPPPPPEKAPEPEKTPEQIVELIKKDMAPIEQAFSTGISDTVREEVVGKLRAAKTQYQSTENGLIALERITGDIDGYVRRAKEERRWRLVLTCVDVYEVLQQGSTKYQRLRNVADLQLKKPRVKLKGFFRDVGSNDQLYVFVEITNPVTNEVFQEQMREGEEKHGLRFSRIIGNQQGVEFEYLAIPGDYFEVKK